MRKKRDTFLCHNSEDKPIVELIAEWLEDKANIPVWLDKWNLVPGDPWQEEIENALDEAQCCVIFLGPNGIGPWQNEEMRSTLEERVSKRTIRVLPVILPGAMRPEKESQLPRFLRRLTWVVFRHKWNEEDALHRLVCGIQSIPPGRGKRKNKTHICPFRGLEVFREQDQEFFFGRESVVQRLMDRLKTNRFLLILGPSGCGKSSIVQAGLIPHLREQALVTLFTPRERPIEELAFSLRNCYPESIRPPVEQLINRLKISSKNLHYISRELLESTGKKNLVFMIDQFEELFTQTGTEGERIEFISALLNAIEVQNGPVIVILTMRSDFMGKCAFYPDLNTYGNEHFFQIEPMSFKELLNAIEEPAYLVGLRFEDGLVNRILADVKGAPGELPLVEHALLELYEMRKGRLMSSRSYDEIGGIAGALVNRAEFEFNKLNEVEKEILRKMFVLRMIQPGEGTEDTRRRAAKDELLAIGGDVIVVEKILNQWINARLLTSTQDTLRQQVLIDVAHEALIRKWDKIQEWMAEGREAARLTGILRQAALEWNQNDRSPGFLFQEARLVQMEELVKTHGGDLTGDEIEFVKAGVKLREVKAIEKEEQRRKELQTAQELAAVNSKAVKRARTIITVIFLSLIAVTYLFINSDKNEKKARRQLAVNYWDTSQRMREDNYRLKSLHLYCEALTIEKDERFQKVLLTDMNSLWRTAPLLHIFLHEKGINGAIFNKDGARILTWSWDRTARFWDASTGKPIGEEMKHESSVEGAIFNKDETRILTWSGDEDLEIGTVRLWDAVTGTRIGEVMKHEGAVKGGIFNKAETHILSWSEDGTARLWDAATGNPFGEVMKTEYPVNGAIFNNDGTRILTWSGGMFKKIDTIRIPNVSVMIASSGGSARMWDAATGKPIGEVMKHESSVEGAIFNKDETRILTWGGDIISKGCTARLWNAVSGNPIGEVMKHEKRVKAAIFNNGESHILTWSEDGTARLWDAATGNPIGEVMRHDSSVNGAIFNKEGSSILTWSADGTARLWESATGKPIGEVMRHDSSVNGAIFSKEGSSILTWSADGTARLWDATTGKPIGEDMRHEGDVYGAIFNHDCTRILTREGDYTARLWDAATGKPISGVMRHEKEVNGAIFNQNGTRILTWSTDGTARLWDAAIGKPIDEVIKHEDEVKGAIFNKDKTRILTWSTDGTARLWDAAIGKPIGEVIKHEEPIWGAIFNKDETRILTRSRKMFSKFGTIRLWDAATAKPIGEAMKNVNGAIFNEDGAHILTWSAGGTTRLWNAATGKPIGEVMRHDASVNGAIFNQDGTRILTWSGDAFSEIGTARVWDVATGKPIGDVMKHDKGVNGAIFNKNETSILTWSADGTARLWNAATGKPIGEVMRHDASVNGAIFNQDGTRILTWSGDAFSEIGTARLWDAATGKPIGEVMKHDKRVNGVIFNHDETRILTWSGHYFKGIGTARLWDADTGKPIGAVMKHKANVDGAIFNKDETIVLTWSEEYKSKKGTVRLWDASTGKPIGEVMNHESSVIATIFNKNETRIFTWSKDGTVRLWDIAIDPDYPMEYIKLQAMAITGTSYDISTNTVYTIPSDQWLKIKEQYMNIAAHHYQSCRFLEGNVFRRVFPEEARKVSGEW